MRFLGLLALLVCMHLTMPVHAADPGPYRIAKIEFAGLGRTSESVVYREMTFEAGDVVEKPEIEESVQRLRNLGLFRTAEYRLAPVDDDSYELLITVDERWTLMPFGNIRFGGNLFSLTAGLFDINLLGLYYEAGLQYSRLGDTNSFLVWFHDPRFLNQRLLVGTDVAWTNRLRGFYDQDDGSFEGAYLRFRRQFRVFVNKEFENWLALGATFSGQFDEFSFGLLSEEGADEYLASFGSLPENTRLFTLSTTLRVGRINAFSYNFEGARFIQSIAHSDTIWGSTHRQTTLFSEVRGYARLPLKINLAGRAGFGTTTGDHIEQQFFVGGFGTLRGFIDSRFRGKHTWYSNAEFRIPSFDHPWFVLQHIAFLDAAGADDRPSQIWTVDGASTGLGLRLIIPKIFSFVARVDYAVSIVGNGASSLSFGAQQFF